uniref:Ring finger and FYVE like domain containing E3 ubiquitin protein ligase n=1 Tax=Sciurus vulgaris TaxID=55149 RepID=A0A8D2CWY2_SCIVU
MISSEHGSNNLGGRNWRQLAVCCGNVLKQAKSDFIMWATCCNWFCLDGQPEEVPPAPGARTQAYSNPGYSSFPSPTGLEPSCKACGANFANTDRKANGHVSQDQEEPVYLESTARAPTEDETQSIDSEDSFVPGRRASLSDLTHLEDIEGLTVRQLKEILARNFVNYKGCCEKWELMERVTRLYKDQKGLQHLVCGAEDQNGGAMPPALEENLCKICMDSPIDCVLLECGHMVTCTKCGKRMNECPICRQYVIRAVHVFRS